VNRSVFLVTLWQCNWIGTLLLAIAVVYCRRTLCNKLPPCSMGISKKGRGNPYLITEHRVPELSPVLDSQPAGDVSHKPIGKLPLLTTRPKVTLVTLKRAATSFAAW